MLLGAFVFPYVCLSVNFLMLVEPNRKNFGKNLDQILDTKLIPNSKQSHFNDIRLESEIIMVILSKYKG